MRIRGNPGGIDNTARSKSMMASSIAAQRTFLPVMMQTAAAINTIAVEYARNGRPGTQGGPGTGPLNQACTRN